VRPPAAPVHLAVQPDAPDAAPLLTTVIGPPSGWQLVNASELWHNRELLFFLIWRDVKIRYKQTALGAAWAVIQPVLMMIIFTFVFSRMGKLSSGSVPYPIFAFAGLLPWTFFSAAVTNSANSVINSQQIITKIYFPRLAIPFASAGASLVDFAVAFLVMLVLMAWYRVMPGFQFLLVPILTLILLFASLGVGTLLAALIVSYRDFKYVLTFLVQLWMYATPSIYMDVYTSAGPRMRMLLWINPMVSLIASFRAAILGLPMYWGQLLAAAGFSVLAFVVGCFYFRKVEDNFADLI
jgi:lipopolysaccharide transport system permease protein